MDIRFIGQFIANIRKDSRLTRSQCFKQTGISVVEQKEFELGVKVPPVDKFFEIINYYGFDYADFQEFISYEH